MRRETLSFRLFGNKMCEMWMGQAEYCFATNEMGFIKMWIWKIKESAFNALHSNPCKARDRGKLDRTGKSVNCIRHFYGFCMGCARKGGVRKGWRDGDRTRERMGELKFSTENNTLSERSFNFGRFVSFVSYPLFESQLRYWMLRTNGTEVSCTMRCVDSNGISECFEVQNSVDVFLFCINLNVSNVLVCIVL